MTLKEIYSQKHIGTGSKIILIILSISALLLVFKFYPRESTITVLFFLCLICVILSYCTIAACMGILWYNIKKSYDKYRSKKRLEKGLPIIHEFMEDYNLYPNDYKYGNTYKPIEFYVNGGIWYCVFEDPETHDREVSNFSKMFCTSKHTMIFENLADVFRQKNINI